MKKYILVTVLVLLMSLNFCSKKSSEPESEDRVTLEITVLRDGSPVQNLFVKVEAVIWKSTYIGGGETRNEAYETSEDADATTNIYGKVSIVYVNKSVPSRNGILIEKITIKEGTTVLQEDTESKVIEKNHTLSLSYDV